MFLNFIDSPTGRGVRVAVGIALIVTGVVIGGVAGWLLAIIGLEPLVAGLFDFSLFAPMVHKPFRGAEFRRTVTH